MFEVENWLKLTAAEIREASLVRTQWYQAVRRFMETYEFMLIPSAQLFPFDAKLDWPHEIGGKRMQNYYDWMDAQVQITMSATPCAECAGRVQRAGLTHGDADRGTASGRSQLSAARLCVRTGDQLGRDEAARAPERVKWRGRRREGSSHRRHRRRDGRAPSAM